MPPKSKVSREDILTAGLELVRQSGAQALNARAVAAKLGVSTQPIFSNYATMDDLRRDVIAQADALYQSYIRGDMEHATIPAYKASGMAYIRFAKEEQELFKLLFMRNRTQEVIQENSEEIAPLLALIQAQTGMSRELAYGFHLEMWVYVHGLATMVATGFLDWDWEMISKMLTDVFEGLKLQYKRKEEG